MEGPHVGTLLDSPSWAQPSDHCSPGANMWGMRPLDDLSFWVQVSPSYSSLPSGGPSTKRQEEHPHQPSKFLTHRIHNITKWFAPRFGLVIQQLMSSMAAKHSSKLLCLPCHLLGYPPWNPTCLSPSPPSGLCTNVSYSGRLPLPPFKTTTLQPTHFSSLPWFLWLTEFFTILYFPLPISSD